MTQTLAISKELTSMAAVQERFNLTYTTDDRFFIEWFENLLALTDVDRTTLAHLQQRFFEHRDRGLLPEGTVDKLIVSPLLDLAGLYDSRFTNGDEFRFIKLLKSPNPQFDLSDILSLLPPHRSKLPQILQALRHIGSLI